MSARDDDAMFEFPEETPGSHEAQPHDEERVLDDAPEGVFRVTRAVPPPVQHVIDALVDAISAGSRPRVTGELEPIAEADDTDLGEYAVVPRELRRRSRLRFMHPAAFRFAGGAVAAFALGTVIAWAVLRSFDAAPRSIAVHPTTVEPAAAPTTPPRSTVPVPPPTATPARPSSTIAPSSASVSPPRVAAAPPAVIPRQGVLPAPAAPVRSDPAAVTAPRRASAPGAPPPGATVEAVPIAPPSAPAIATTGPDASARDDLRVVEMPRVIAPALTAPSPIVSPSPAASAAPAVVAVARDHDAVLETVREYRQAYEAMDVTATAAIWPSVDRRALARAFSTLKSQELALEHCEVAIADTNATTRCRGTVEYVRKIGNPTPRTGHQEFVFKMRKLGDDWFIDDVSASQAAVARN